MSLSWRGGEGWSSWGRRLVQGSGGEGGGDLELSYFCGFLASPLGNLSKLFSSLPLCISPLNWEWASYLPVLDKKGPLKMSISSPLNYKYVSLHGEGDFADYIKAFEMGRLP